MFLVVLVDEFLDESCREEFVILVWFRWNGKVGLLFWIYRSLVY